MARAARSAKLEDTSADEGEAHHAEPSETACRILSLFLE